MSKRNLTMPLVLVTLTISSVIYWVYIKNKPNSSVAFPAIDPQASPQTPLQIQPKLVTASPSTVTSNTPITESPLRPTSIAEAEEMLKKYPPIIGSPKGLESMSPAEREAYEAQKRADAMSPGDRLIAKRAEIVARGNAQELALFDRLSNEASKLGYNGLLQKIHSLHQPSDAIHTRMLIRHANLSAEELGQLRSALELESEKVKSPTPNQ